MSPLIFIGFSLFGEYRSIDLGFHPEGFSPIDASPVNWVGDQQHKWVTDEMILEEGCEKVDIALEGFKVLNRPWRVCW